MKILIADDDELVVQLLKTTFAEQGHEVVHVADGVGVGTLAASERPDLIVLDIMMPGIDGIEALRRLRTDPVTSTVPVIMLTTRGYRNEVVGALTLGACDYLLKPFTTEVLLERVRRALGAPAT